MKLICAEYNGNGGMIPCVVGDNALLRNNNDFYYPSFTGELSCVPQLVLRACKLGKGIPERFVCRYYNEVGVGIRFYADTFGRGLAARGLPETPASSFDESAAMSAMKTYGGEDLCFSFWLNGEERYRGNVSALQPTVDRFIADASSFYMIKIGDLFFCGNVFRCTGLKIGDRLRMFLEDEKLMDFYIR